MTEPKHCSRCKIILDGSLDTGGEMCGWCECDIQNEQRRRTETAKPNWFQRIVQRHRHNKLRDMIEVADCLLRDISETASKTGYHITADEAYRQRQGINLLRALSR